MWVTEYHLNMDHRPQMSSNSDDARVGWRSLTLSLLEVMAGIVLLLLLSAIDGTNARSWRFTLLITVSLLGAIVFFVLVFHWFRNRSVRVSETRERLVSSYLSALDHSSLNPATAVSIPRTNTTQRSVAANDAG